MLSEKMARNTKKKLAIFAGTSKCLIYAEAKYCASEMPGEIKYYECSRTEYCCGIGCCVSPGMHFHHLWYYWILVIIMFLVCSGGGWWYRYWLQGRYRAAASAIPARASASRAQNSLRGPTCQGQRARISYNPGRNTVLLHRMWKGPQRNGASPAFNGNATTSTHYQNMSVVLNDANCPYYQLYGPPPSYETVIAQTRGKISNPASPESTNAQTTMQSASIAANSIVSQCYSYSCNSSARSNTGLEQNAQFSNGGGTSSRQIESGDAGIAPFTHFPRYCTIADGTIRQDVCIPFGYQEQSFVPRNNFSPAYRGTTTNGDPHAYSAYAYGGECTESSNSSEPENQGYPMRNTERYATVNVDCTAGGSRAQGVWEPNCRSVSKVQDSRLAGAPSGRIEENGERCRENTSAAVKLIFPLAAKNIEDEGDEGNDENDGKSAVNSLEDFDFELSKNRRVYGGSLKAAGRYAGKDRGDEYSVQRGFSKILPHSCDGLINTEPAIPSMDDGSRDASPLENRGNVGTSSFQSNPSNNVILECFVSEGVSSSTENVDKLDQSGSRLADASTNSDAESKKYRLDRSKSLD